MYAGAGSSFNLQGVFVYNYLKNVGFQWNVQWKEKNWYTFGTCRVQGAYFNLSTSPCGYHQKEKLLMNK